MDGLKIHSRQRKYDGWAKLEEVEFRRVERDGEWSGPLRRLVVECGDAVGVLLYSTQKDRLLFVRQARLPLERHADLFPIELVAGKIDAGEQPSDSARREVKEEVGVTIEDLTPISCIYPSPGVLSEMVSIFYAEFDAEPKITAESTEEGVEFVWLSRDDAWDMCKNGAIRDAKTVVALQWLRSRG